MRRARVAALFGAGVLLTWVTASGVRAAARSEMLSAAAAASGFAHVLHAEESETLFINGLSFVVATASTSEPLAAVLDHVESACRSADGTFRVADAERGVVACLDPIARTAHVPSLSRRLRAFLASGDLAAIGELRVVTALRGTVSTTSVTVRTHGPLPLFQAFPKHGDAPGRDLAGVPRPDGAVRRLSAWTPDGAGGAAIAVYSVQVAALAALRAYRAVLDEAGWTSRVDARDPSRFTAALGARRIVAVAEPDERTVVLVSL